MQKWLALLLLLVSSLSFQSSNPNPAPATPKTYEGKLKVLTWNVQMVPRIGSIFSSSLRKMQEERTEWIIEHIEKSDYDIILLQECFDNKFIDAAQDRLERKYPHALLPDRPHFYKLSNGLMILSKYHIEKIENIVFKRLSQSDMFTAKGAVLARIRLDTQSLYLVNTHLQADYDTKKYQEIRRDQLSCIQTELIQKHLKNSESKLLVAGDLNIEEDLESAEYKSLTKEFRWKDWVYDFFKKPSTSFDKQNFWNKEYKQSCRLDYFLANFTSKLFKIKIEKPKRTFGNDEIDLADHYGISAEFSL
ncbi:MAG: endonuclease/exonuclease/phosphatase family protein [Chitinophagales bacterium]|jgi:endonuclease/exonuclease/phosphatase family metal-dependent hydrolase|nr:endonuclease/exonuclease/phosphatase family protein [Sphingobacteriales bacterium]